jgi:predicted permease
MNSFRICLTAIAPIFLIIAAGYAARRFGAIREEDVPRMNSVAFRFFMSCMCFYNVYASDLSSALRPRLIAFTVPGVLIAYVLSLIYGVLRVPRLEQRGVVIQGMFRSNYTILGLPLAAGLFGNGEIGVAAVTSAVVVPIFNTLSVITLEVCSGKKPGIPKLLLAVTKNPLILGTAAGLLMLALGIRLPAPLEKAAQMMSQAASPLMLFLLGAFFRFRGLKDHWRQLLTVCLGRLVVIPAIAMSAAVALGFRGIELITLLTVFASSTAVASFPMAQQQGGDAALAGDIVVATSACASVTLFLWCFLFKSLNYF